MKKLFAAAALVLCSTAVSAQEEVVAGRAYELTVDIPVREVKVDGTGLNNPAATIASPVPRSQFTVVRIREDSAIVRFWAYDEKSTEHSTYNVNSSGDTRYFAILRSALSAVSIPFYARSWSPSVSAGAILIPVKMRAKPFDFSKDITLGPSIAFRWRTTNRVDQFVSLVGSFGLTSVQLDSASTQGMVRQPLDVTAVTPALGIVYEVDNFQLGVFMGWDRISDNERLRWQHQGERWISVGMGYSILSRTSTRQPLSGKQ